MKKELILLLISLIVMIVIITGCSTGEASFKPLNNQLKSVCNPAKVTNGEVAAYPGCAITCDSGYTKSGNRCIFLLCDGWEKHCSSLRENESKRYALAGVTYNVRLKSILYQNFPGGIHKATFEVDGRELTLQEEGRSNYQMLPGGRTISLDKISYQDYAGGIHSVSFCIIW